MWTFESLISATYEGIDSPSATLTVGGSFNYWMRFHGLGEAEQAIFPSPFDHAQQALDTMQAKPHVGKLVIRESAWTS